MTANSDSSITKDKCYASRKFQKQFSLFSPPHKAISPLDFQFDRLQPPDGTFTQEDKLEFGQFLARHAQVDEEYWTAAWLRAESHWEDKSDDRYADTFKRKFAEQEYNAIKRRSTAALGNKCSCIIAVKKDNADLKHTSVMGTLDLSTNHFSEGDTFPGEQTRAPFFCNIERKDTSAYGYIANLCVDKSARRQGVASNMLHFAIGSAKTDGVEKVFVHVHKHNRAAHDLYYKIGFKVVEDAILKESDKQISLLCFQC